MLKTLKKIAAISTGVVMAGATITGALALDLGNYPDPFVVGGVYDDSNVLVVGDQASGADSLGAVDIASNLQYESRTAVESDSTSVSVEGGITKQVAIGSILTATGFFDPQQQDDEISNLQDTEITFSGTAYDISEELNLSTSGPRIVSSLGVTVDDDYGSNVYMDVQAKDYIKFYYVTDEAGLNYSSASTVTPLDIDFCGQHFKITDVAVGGESNAEQSFTAYVGESHYLQVDESVEVDGHTVELIDVSSTSVVVVVDGEEEIITTSAAETVSGIEIAVDEVFSRTEREDSSASLVIGEEATKTYKDGDAFPGEDEDDPTWVWDLDALGNTGAGVQKFGLESDFYYNDAGDTGIPTIGGCITLPNDFVEICLDSLSVGDDDYKMYTFEVDENLDASDTFGAGNASLDALHIESAVDEGIELQAYTTGAAAVQNVSTNLKTTDIWLWTSNDNVDLEGNALNGSVDVFYKDTSDNKIKHFGAIGNTTGTEIARFNFENTKTTNAVLKVGSGVVKQEPPTSATLSALYIEILPDVSTDMTNGGENISMNWTIDAAGYVNLGETADTEEADELTWTSGSTSTSIGTKDEDHRTYYGITISDPKATGAGDKVELMVPNDQVFANVVIKGTATTVTSGSTNYVAAEVTPVTKLASEVGTASDYNLILVGGPCANDLVEDVIGLSCGGWAYETGEAVVKLVENGDKVAMLVAGTVADDTRRAAKAIAS
mgnify:FL=1